MVYVGIDLGGTNIAVGVVSEAGSILAQAGAKTLAGRPYQAIIRDMAELVKRAVAKARLTLHQFRLGERAPARRNAAVYPQAHFHR